MCRVATKYTIDIVCRKHELSIVEAVHQNGKLCNKVEMVRNFTYLGDSINVSA